MSKDSRINVYLHEWKELLEEFCVESHGDISKIVRELVQGHVQGDIMFIDPKVHELLDSERDSEAIEMLVAQLQPLRERRLRIGEAVSKRRAAAKQSKGLKGAGVKTPEEIETEKAYDQYLQRFLEKKRAKEGGEQDGKEGH